MTYAIVYNSRGGNTKLVAEGLQKALAEAGAEAMLTELTTGAVAEASKAVAQADTVLAGFWTDKGSCTPEMAELLDRLHGKRVFLFGTAGFGGEPAYFERILTGVEEKLPQDATYLGGAMCQGKMGPAVRARYEAMLVDKPGDARIEAMIANFDAALEHPNAADIDAIAAAAKDALGL